MSVYSGPADWWTDGTEQGRAYIASRGIAQGGLVLNLDTGVSASYPGSGITWTDLSGNGNHCTLYNSPTYSASNGGILTFDGTNDYAQANSSSTFAFGTGNFTLEVWIYPQSFASYTHMIALPDQGTFALKASRTGDGVEGSIYFYSPAYSTSGSTPGWILTLNRWQHVVFKRESSVGYAYLDAALAGSKPGFTNNFTAQLLNIHNGWASEFTQCSIANVRIYNRSLSDAEIKQNFDALRNRFGV